MYWPGNEDRRDHVRGEDTNESARNEIVVDVMARISAKVPNELTPDERAAILKDGLAKLDGSPLLDITEYGRPVHAEMEALLACTRSGVSPVGGTLYCTTFPCHNCAKHIVAAGIQTVVYVEPYPKSQAVKLFEDSITAEEGAPEADDRRVLFRAFRGIGPRRFFDLFSIGLGSGYKVKRKKNGKVTPWERSNATLRVQMLPNDYFKREQAADEEVLQRVKKAEELDEQCKS